MNDINVLPILDEERRKHEKLSVYYIDEMQYLAFHNEEAAQFVTHIIEALRSFIPGVIEGVKIWSYRYCERATVLACFESVTGSGELDLEFSADQVLIGKQFHKYGSIDNHPLASYYLPDGVDAFYLIKQVCQAFDLSELVFEGGFPGIALKRRQR